MEVDEDAEYAVWLWNLWLAVETDTNPITCSEWLRSFHEPENPDVIKSIKRQMERKRIAQRVYFGRLLEQKRIADAETRKEQAAKAAVLEDIVAELELAKQVLDVEAKMVHEADRKARKAAKAVAAAEAERKAAKAAKFSTGQRLAGLPGDAPGISSAKRSGRAKRAISASSQPSSGVGKWLIPAIANCSRWRSTVCMKSRRGLACGWEAPAAMPDHSTPRPTSQR